MAESSSSALPGGVEWLPTLGGAHLLRVEVRGAPPALVLHTKEGSEQRIEPGPQARFDGTTTYMVPAGVMWARASLAWPDGTRAVLPSQADVIALPRRRAEPSLPRRPEPLPWTAPPSDTKIARRATFEQELAVAAQAMTRVAESERSTRDAVLAILDSARSDLQAARAAQADEVSLLTAIAEELEAERAAHAKTRETLAEALAAARAARDIESLNTELVAARAAAEIGADARAHLASARRDAALARAEVASLRADLEAERAARASAEAALAEAGDGPAYLERVAKLDRDVEGLRSQVRLERRAREQAETAAAAARRPPAETGRLVASLDAAAAALRATTAPLDASPADAAALAAAPPTADGGAPPPAGGEASPVAARAGAAARLAVETAVAAALPVSQVSSSPTMYRAARPALEPPDREKVLRLALTALAVEDPVAAGMLIAGLLPAQGACIDETLTYDLTIRSVGTFAVFVADGVVRVQRTTRRRGRGEAAFHLSAEPLALAKLLAGDQRKVRRFGRDARYSGRRKQLRTLAALPAARLSLADTARAGARLEPSLVYRALPFAVPAEWTRGHVFTVAQEINELSPRAWYITARDGVPLRVIEYTSGAAADATVTMSLAAFERFLRGEPALDGDRPAIHGNLEAVATLKRWTDLIV